MRTKKGVWIAVVFSAIIVMVHITMFVLHHMNRSYPDAVRLSDGWTVSGAANYENAALEDVEFEPVKRGDEYTFQRVLPQDTVLFPVLEIYLVHCATRVYVDDEVIYEYGFEQYEKKKLLGYGMQIVPLPYEYAGKTLTIYMKFAEKNATTNMQVPVICDGTKYIRNLCMEKRNVLAVNLFLVVFGIVLFLLSIPFSLMNSRFKNLACIGGFSTLMSVWSICSSDLFLVFTYSLDKKTYIEFLTLYCCTIPLLIYFWDEMHNRKHNWITKIYYIVLGAQTAFFVFACIAQFFSIISFAQLLVIQHGLFLLFGFFLMSICVNDFIAKNFQHIWIFAGTTILLIIGLADIIRYNWEKYFISEQGYRYINITFYGTLFFIVFQSIDFFLSVHDELVTVAHSEVLERMAYTDELTGIYNRRKCEEVLDEMDHQKQACGIFYFDLNNLKQINDTYGHEKGDELIKCFATSLQEAFENRGVVCRMGGDEFIAIISNPKGNDSKHFSKKIMERLNENQKQLQIDVKISTAIGYASTNFQKKHGIKETMRKADARLYKNKSYMKNQK